MISQYCNNRVYISCVKKLHFNKKKKSNFFLLAVLHFINILFWALFLFHWVEVKLGECVWFEIKRKQKEDSVHGGLTFHLQVQHHMR